MRCDDIRELILIPSRPGEASSARPDDSSITDHIQTCGACSSFAQRMAQVDIQLRDALRIAPPADLQASLIAMALEHAASVQLINAPATTAPVFDARTTAHAESATAIGESAVERRRERVVATSVPLSPYRGSGLFDTRFWSVIAAFGLFVAAALQIAGWFAATPNDN